MHLLVVLCHVSTVGHAISFVFVNHLENAYEMQNSFELQIQNDEKNTHATKQYGQRLCNPYRAHVLEFYTKITASALSESLNNHWLVENEIESATMRIRKLRSKEQYQRTINEFWPEIGVVVKVINWRHN